jgi:phenylalanyl-tRNA synthetase beta chain
VKIYLDRLAKIVGTEKSRVIDRLPYAGLDIEGIDEESIRIEYNPNRPDFSTDYGIARALKGLLEIETGLPRYNISKSNIKVFVNKNLSKVRPFIACAVASNLYLDDETIRQLISMQEDLHNGLGRKRRKLAIGLHNLDAITPPIYYEGRELSFTFTPLGAIRPMTLREILTETETGREYGRILSNSDLYPILRDSKGTVLSFPPIINGEATKIDTSTKNLFIDITSIDENAGLDALAIITTTLSDAGAKLGWVRINYSKKSIITPDLSPTTINLDQSLIRKITGLELSRTQIKNCLRRSRFDLTRNRVTVPRYRIDILHPIDITEEVLIGYGMDKIDPLYPASYEPGGFHRNNIALDRVGQIMTQSGFIETINYELMDEKSLYLNFEREENAKIEVENPRSLEHNLLRDSLIPSLMIVLARNIKEEYPQNIFEIGKVYKKVDSQIKEGSHLAALMAHSSATYSEAKMHLSALIRSYSGIEIVTRVSRHWPFVDGRCAEIIFDEKHIGYLGEIKPSVIDSFRLEVPVSGFELDLLALRND